MKKIKINTDRPSLSSEDISAGKDFNSLYQQYTAVAPKPWYKSTGFLASSALVVVVAVVTVTQWHSIQHYFSNSPKEVPFINEPVAGASIQFTNYQLDANKDTVLQYETGTTVHIPADAFLSEDGTLAKGKVDIKYREFHDAVDVFLSGIPMGYDSAGMATHLESGGMMQFEASQNGKVLKPNPSSYIHMSFATADKGDYNLYYLDTVARKWNYSNQPLYAGNFQEPQAERESTKHIDASKKSSEAYTVAVDTFVDEGMTVTPQMADINTKITTVQKEITKIERTEPIKPLEANTKKRQFTIDVKPEQFPEISSFKDVLFEPEDGQKIAETDYTTVWEDVDLKENKHGKNFKMTLTKGNHKLEVIVVPVYEGESYAKAQKEFQKKITEYSKILKNRKNEETRLAAELKKQEEKQKQDAVAQQKKYEQEMAAATTQWKKDSLNNERSAQARARQQAQQAARQSYASAGAAASVGDTKGEKAYNATGMVYTTFAVLNFGIINCDRMLPVKQQGQILAEYRNENNSHSDIVSASLVLLDYNSSIIQSVSHVDYYPTRCMVITVDAAGAIMIYTPDQYGKLYKGIEKHTFMMKEIKDKDKLADELKKYIKQEAAS